eukprot:117241-Chlamydomonas_euryale.AAC.4
MAAPCVPEPLVRDGELRARDLCQQTPVVHPTPPLLGAQGQPVDGESLELLRQMRPALERSRYAAARCVAPPPANCRHPLDKGMFRPG